MATKNFVDGLIPPKGFSVVVSIVAYWNKSAKEQKTPANFGVKLANIVKNHFRGIIGGIGVIIFFGVWARPFERTTLYTTVMAVWFTMLWLVLWQPVSIQSTGLLVIFSFPMMGVLSSLQTCPLLFNEQIILLFLGNWLLMLFNCSGIDKRIAYFFLCFDDACSTTKIVAKTMMAAFFLSILSNRLLIAPLLIDMLLGPIDEVHKPPDFNYNNYKGVICSAIAVSSTLGSLCIIHNNLTTLQFKALFQESAGGSLFEYPDIFNYLQYSAFAFPTFIVMFLLNVGYHIILATKLKMPDALMTTMITSLKKERDQIGKWNCHQVLSVIFYILIMACFLTRWSAWLNMGWASFRVSVASKELPVIKDATTAAIFVFILHLIPKSVAFITSMNVKEYKDLKPPKIESGLLFWKTIDKNTDYALFFIIGAGIVLMSAIQISGLNLKIAEFGKNSGLNKLDLYPGILVVGLLTVVGANLMNGIGWQSMWLPLVLNLPELGDKVWGKNMYLLSLIIGIGCSFGFMAPFEFTTSYFSKTKGKVPLLVQMKYGIASVIICLVILFLSVAFYAPLLWDPDGKGVTASIRL